MPPQQAAGSDAVGAADTLRMVGAIARFASWDGPEDDVGVRTLRRMSRLMGHAGRRHCRPDLPSATPHTAETPHPRHPMNIRRVVFIPVRETTSASRIQAAEMRSDASRTLGGQGPAGRSALKAAGPMPSSIRPTRYGKNGLEDMRSSESRLTISAPRSPRAATAPSWTPKSSSGSGWVPYRPSLVGNGSATWDKE